jgi:hypothetical protein
MPSIPIDILRDILEHIDLPDLVTLCQVNKIFCSCSQDVLYRAIDTLDTRVIRTLASSTHLAKRVRSFRTSILDGELATALHNMSSLRKLNLDCPNDGSVLDRCTFKLHTFSSHLPYRKPLQNFLNNQPSLTNVTFFSPVKYASAFDQTCLPNLTQVMAEPAWLPILIPGRPVREVTVLGVWDLNVIDMSCFTLSIAPIRKLSIPFDLLYPKPGSFLASILPSLVHLKIDVYDKEFMKSPKVRRPLFDLSI